MTVIVYTKPNCQGCRLTKQHLERRRITYVALPFDERALEVAQIGGITAAPLVGVDNGGGNFTWWGGYRPDAIDALVTT